MYGLLHYTVLLCALAACTAAQYINEQATVYIATGPLTTTFLTNVLQAYQLVAPGVDIQLLRTDDSDTAQLIHNNTVDLALYIGTQSASDVVLYPDTAVYPLLAVGLAFTYNLPNMQAGFVLTLSVATAAQIFAGSITQWDHALIRADNPRYTMPAQPIHVIVSDFDDGKNQLLSYACNATYSVFGDTVGVGFTLNWTNASYANVTHTNDYLANSIATKLTPYSISYAAPTDLAQFNLPYANMRNAYGSVVQLTADTLLISGVSAGVHSDVTQYNDFSNTAAEQSYPIAAAISLLYNKNTIRTSCNAKITATQFISWFNTSAAVQALATTISLLPAVVNRVGNIPPFQLYCNSNIIELVTPDIGRLAGSDALGSYLPLVLSFYQSYDAERTYVSSTADQFDSLIQLTSGHIDAAIVQPDHLNHTNLELWTAYLESGDIVVLPTAVVTAVPIFNLPQAIANLTDPTVFNTTLYSAIVTGQPGIALDTPTLSGIYTGNINDWTDPALSLYTPWLAERVQYLQAQQPNISIPITLVICCDDPAVSTPAAQVMSWGFAADLDPNGYLGGINYVPDGFNYSHGIANDYNRWQLPFSWHTNLTQLGNTINYIMMSSETQLGETVSLTDGAISYYMATQELQNIYTEFSLLYPPLDSTGQPILNNSALLSDFSWSNGEVNNSLGCIIPQYSTDISYFSMQLDSLAQTVACWSFCDLVSTAVLSHYSDAYATFPISVATANKTLNMVQWLLTDAGLDSTARSRGIGLMLNDAEESAATVYALDYIQCNGANCLITLPTHWQISTGVVAFGYALGVLMCVACTATAALLYYYRMKPTVRSASITFQLIILFGLTCLFLSAVMIVQAPTSSSCSAFAWLANFGLQLTFVPLFLKMYRIYKIFSRKQLKIVRISDLKLLSYAAVLLVFDIVVMSAWQGVSPLQPITTHVYDGVHDQQYLQCNLQDKSFVVILGIEKAALLLFGSIMSFGTRKVNDTFNESTSVAMSIYNTIIATSVLIPIIAFVNALGDTLVILILIIIMWVGVSTYAMVFATKLYALTISETITDVSFSHAQSSMHGAGYSFVSVQLLNAANIDSYYHALQKHMREVAVKRKELTGADTLVKPESNVLARPSVKESRHTSYAAPASPVNAHHSHVNSYEHQYVAPVRHAQPTFASSNGKVIPSSNEVLFRHLSESASAQTPGATSRTSIS